ncbi:MAG: hypothetical protein QOE99_1088 [Actinomycetota bacterium]|jgi:hypothetical protein|nr:hypothetical protein [Actinomycetota bacterium]
MRSVVRSRSSRLGTLSCAAMMASGVAGVLIPQQVSEALHLTPTDPRGVAETRAGLGGTYALLGAWALLSRQPLARRAVGVTWLGAAAARLASLRLDEPEADAAFWAYLAGELVLGSTAFTTTRG